MIVRTRNKAQFTVIDNRVLNDSRLSWRARGVLTYLLSKPDGWEVMKQNLINESPDGRRVVESTLEELEAVGYITTGAQGRSDGGRFDHVATIVHEEPTSGFVAQKAKAQATPMAETYSGANSQVGTDVHLPRAEEPRAVDARGVKTQSASTEEERGSTRRSRACANASDGALDEELTEDTDTLIAASALFGSMKVFWPDQTHRQANFRVGQVIARVKDRAGDEEIPAALAAITEQLERRAELARTGTSDPPDEPTFILGVADQLIENWEREKVWVGAVHKDLVVEFHEFADEHGFSMVGGQ